MATCATNGTQVSEIKLILRFQPALGCDTGALETLVTAVGVSPTIAGVEMKRSALVALCSGLIFACGPTRPTGTGGTGGSAGSAGTGGGGTGGGTGTNLPCNIDAIFKAKCQFCHASPPLY